MHKNKIILGILVLAILSVFVACLISLKKFAFFNDYLKSNSNNKTYIEHTNIRISSNGKYVGRLESSKVRIEDYDGKEVSQLDLNEYQEYGYPLIALGDDSYFLLFHWVDIIIQFDFSSKKICETKVKDAASITCEDGFLFIGKWKRVNDRLSEFFIPCYKGFYANQYCKEKDFGDKIRDLVPDENGRCVVGNIELYYHREGFFSNEPQVNDFPVTVEGDRFTVDDYKAESDQETQNHKLLIKEISGLDNSDAICHVSEYQVGNEIYGVCNIGHVFKEDLCPQDVIQSYYYKIIPKENRLEIISETKSCIAIMTTESTVIYQDNMNIVRKNIESGSTDILYTRKKTEENMKISVHEEFLQIEEGIEYSLVKWN